MRIRYCRRNTFLSDLKGFLSTCEPNFFAGFPRLDTAKPLCLWMLTKLHTWFLQRNSLYSSTPYGWCCGHNTRSEPVRIPHGVHRGRTIAGGRRPSVQGVKCCSARMTCEGPGPSILPIGMVAMIAQSHDADGHGNAAKGSADGTHQEVEPNRKAKSIAAEQQGTHVGHIRCDDGTAEHQPRDDPGGAVLGPETRSARSAASVSGCFDWVADCGRSSWRWSHAVTCQM